MTPELKYIIESLLFVSQDPISLEKLSGLLPMFETPQIREAIAGLEADYHARGGGFYLTRVAGGFQLRSRPEYAEWIARLVQPAPQRLSQAALETLAIIAYKQPVIRTDVEHIRGVDCGGVLRLLLERKLIRILGRREIPGRPMIYGTTKIFLELFGLNDLKDLPTTKEIQEMTASETELSSMGTAANPEAGPQPMEPDLSPEAE
jgi:segregation and condensation protein B